ncbi:protein turtle-like [Branchiostoma lanceolatum]|uniref:protein turtle-like n=1 Tax=Branchiostoma lanceolatum TaxID=7740 RepID=UPI003452A8F9
MTPTTMASFFMCLLTATTFFQWKSKAVATVQTMTTNLSSVTAIEGETVVLPAESSPDYTVFAQTWNKLVGGMRGVRTAVYMYASTTKTSMSLGPLKGRAILDSDGSLRIMAARKSDGGLYVLSSVLDVVGQEDHYVQLTILVLPVVQITTKKPVVVMEHSSVILNCTVNHTSALTSPPYWESDQLQDVSPHILGNMESDDSYSPWLFLPKFSRDQTGNYSCVAEHLTGKTSDRIYVGVIYPAKILKIAEDSSDDNNVVLHCIAEGNPAPRVSWYRGYSLKPMLTTNGTDTSQRLGLVLSKHNNRTSGQYRCQASNKLADDSKSVYVSIYQRAVTIVEAAESNGIIRVQEGSLFQVITTAGIAAASLCLLLVVLLAGFIFCRKRPGVYGQQEFEYIAAQREQENIPMEQFENDTSLPVTPDWEENDEQAVICPADLRNSPLPTRNGVTYQCRTFVARVIVPYYSHQPGFLSLKINDFVEVIDQTSSGWLYGSIGDRSGVFPATCVEPSGRTSANRRTDRAKYVERQGHQASLVVRISRRSAGDDVRAHPRHTRSGEKTAEEES